MEKPLRPFLIISRFDGMAETKPMIPNDIASNRASECPPS
jgi:hypothetical protein